MERFVLQYFVTDGITYSNEVILPVEGDSKEDVYCLLMDTAMRIYKDCIEKKTHNYTFVMFGHIFEAYDLIERPDTTIYKKKGSTEVTYGEPQNRSCIEVLALDEWFMKKRD